MSSYHRTMWPMLPEYERWIMCFPWKSWSVAMCTRHAVLPIPLRAAITPMFPVPTPPRVDFSRILRGLLRISSFRTMLHSSVWFVAGRTRSGPFLGLFLVLLDKLLALARRHLAVTGEFHGEICLALCDGSQNGRVAEHLRERDLGVH